MRALRRLGRRLGSSIARRSADQRLQDEIEQHLAFQTEENIRAGMTPAEARRQAALKFGAIESIKEAFREEHRLPILETTAYDLRHAIRQLRRSPVFTVTAVLSLAVGIGANAAVVTIADRVLVRSLPVTAPDELIVVADQRARADSSPRFSYPFYAALADNTILAGLAARFVLPVNVAIDGSASRVRGELVSGTYFGVLGTAAHIGRPLTAADDRTPGSHPVAVIGAGLWERSFGSDPGVLGRTLTINNHTFSIVGVADRRFTGTEVGFTTDVWIPMAMQKEVGRDLLNEPRTNWLEMIGRLKPGQSAESAAADLAAYLERARVAAGTVKPGQGRFVLLPAGKGFSPIRGELGPSLQTLVVLTGLALVLACINVASLLVVRSVAREQEFAVRLALGARRSSLIRQVLTETIVLAVLGGAAGLTVAPWAAGLLLVSQPDGPVIDAALDLRVFGFGFAVSMLSALLVGLAPVLVARKVGLSAVRGDRADTTLTTRHRVTARDVIVTGQVAVSLVMLISAALFVQSLRNLHAIDTGFDSGDLLLMSVDPGSAGYDSGRFEGFWREALDRAGRVRGVRSASIARIVPFAFGRQRQPFQNPASGETLEIDTNFVGPAYFRTLNVAMLTGREFDERDGKTSAPVAIVNDRLARLFWPGQDPIGRSIRVGPPGAPMSQIVGVVRDMKYRDLRDTPVPMIYVPIFQTRSTGALTLHVRTASGAGDAAADIRRELQALDRNLPLFAIRTLDQQVSAVLTPSRQAALVSTGFGILALLLSAIGVYGVSALAVSRQTHEIGIRMALGAQPWQIARGMGRRGLVVVTAGLGLGALGAYGFTRTVGTLLYGVSASDAATFAAAAALLAAVAVTAISVPVRAAMRLDAVKAIRYQ